MRKKQIPLPMDRPSMVEANYNELMERARIRKKAYNWTNQYIGDKTGLAETTVGRFFRG